MTNRVIRVTSYDVVLLEKDGEDYSIVRYNVEGRQHIGLSEDDRKALILALGGE